MTMDFQPIQPLWSDFSAAGLAKENEKENENPTLFSDIFQSVIETVEQTDATKNEKEYLLATGQLDNPAELTIAATQAQMSVELLVQLRNKALDAYSELMRINL